MKKNILENLVWLIFIFVGIIFFVIGIASSNMLGYQNKVNIIGTITELYTSNDNETGYKVYVTYNVDGVEYESLLNGYSSNFYIGKEIEIYYDKDNPNIIGMKSLDLMFLLFSLIGFIFLVIGCTGIIVKIKNGKKEMRLKENGLLIYANYIEAVLNTSYIVNGKSPYKIICEWVNPTGGNKYTFKSKNIWTNPENIIKERGIKQFPVFFNNEKNYLVDTEFLIKDNVQL